MGALLKDRWRRLKRRSDAEVLGERRGAPVERKPIKRLEPSSRSRNAQLALDRRRLRRTPCSRAGSQMTNSQADNANSFGQASGRQVIARRAEMFPCRKRVRRWSVSVQRRSEQQVHLEKKQGPDHELLEGAADVASRLQRSCPL